MELGKINAGCDRHLFGLHIVAREVMKLKKLPEIFTDPAFTKRLVEVKDADGFHESSIYF